MNIKIGILLFLSGLLIQELPKNIRKKVKKEIISTYSIESFDMKMLSFSDEVCSQLPASFKDQNLFEIYSGDIHNGFGYVGKAPSRDDHFDYLILFDNDFVILKSKILIYREDYGGEIGSKRWLKQFTGRTKNDHLKLNEDIVAISGATISVRSMTLAVDNVLRSLEILYDKGLLK